MEDVVVRPEALVAFAAECLGALGTPRDEAQFVADSLVQADLWGHSSHGIMRLFWYGARIRTGATDAAARPSEVGGHGALHLLDGGDGLGQVMAHAAMTRAITAAKDHGIGAVSVRRSGHFGTAMYWTRMAAAAGCIGFLSTNASPAMAPWGGAEKRIGNNPFSWAAPAGRHPPMIVDIANTAVARGKLYLARQRGDPIPEGWAIDTEGRATVDPALGIAGTILPMAGHKGYAISLMMDVVSGILAGSAFATDVVGPYSEHGRSGAGHLAMAIDIAALRPLSEFEADMECLVALLKSTPRAPGVEEIFYPGEPEARKDREGRRTGVRIPAATAEGLASEAKSLGIPAPF